jgi:hypothetical protein
MYFGYKSGGKQGRTFPPIGIQTWASPVIYIDINRISIYQHVTLTQNREAWPDGIRQVMIVADSYGSQSYIDCVTLFKWKRAPELVDSALSPGLLGGTAVVRLVTSRLLVSVFGRQRKQGNAPAEHPRELQVTNETGLRSESHRPYSGSSLAPVLRGVNNIIVDSAASQS